MKREEGCAQFGALGKSGHFLRQACFPLAWIVVGLCGLFSGFGVFFLFCFSDLIL